MRIFKLYKLQSLIVVIACLFSAYVCNSKIFYERMHDGSFIVAFPHQLARDQDRLRHEFGKHFNLPQKRTNSKHQYINFEMYPKTQQQVNIGNSKDKQLLLKIKNLCIGEGETQQRVKKLQKFKKGPCSPVVLVPGILATSLILEIDCAKLKNYDGGRIFKSCGWTSCSSLGIYTPDKNYLLWVGLELSLKVTRGYSKCFGDLFGILYDSNSTSANFGSRYSQAAGLKSTWFGNTEDSQPYSECGVNAMRDLSGYVSMLSVLGSQCALNDFGRLIDMLKVMGYQPGLTLQPLPYDFRYGILASTTPNLLPQVINNLYYATGKKVVVVGHSLGTLHTLNGLAYFMSEQQKQKMVRHYIPITPPWLGTVSAIRNMLFGDPSYFTKGLFDSGINKYAQMKFTSTSGSTYDLFLRDAFHRFKDQPWMKEVIERIKYQEAPRNYSMEGSQDKQNGQQDYPMNWFPSKYEECFPRYLKKNYACSTGFVNFLQKPIFQINGQKYYGNQSDITRLITQNLSPAQAKSALSLWAQTKVPGKTLLDLPAPGVNTSIIFTTLYDTQIYYKYKSRPKDDVTDQNTFIEPQFIGNSPGDVSVPSWSPLIFAAKWIHNNTNGNHSVNVIEYCSNYSKVRKYYSALPCQCSSNPFKNQLDCTHPCIISDKYLIAFVLGILTNKMKGYQGENIKDALRFQQGELQKRMQQCSNLKKNSYLSPLSPFPTKLMTY